VGFASASLGEASSIGRSEAEVIERYIVKQGKREV
jgi:hypothetical protein